jgi:hypothetical protein
MASKAVLGKARKRLFNALKQVPTAVHKSLKAQSTATLYVGNIEFNATEKDLRKSLEDCLGYGIVVEKITIPSPRVRLYRTLLGTSSACGRFRHLHSVFWTYGSQLTADIFP